MLINVIYKNTEYKVTCTLLNTGITDSYKINTKKDIKEFLSLLKDILKNKYENYTEYSIYKRQEKSIINEWATHNVLYKLGLFKVHTKDVDIEYITSIDNYNGQTGIKFKKLYITAKCLHYIYKFIAMFSK